MIELFGGVVKTAKHYSKYLVDFDLVNGVLLHQIKDTMLLYLAEVLPFNNPEMCYVDTSLAINKRLMRPGAKLFKDIYPFLVMKNSLLYNPALDQIFGANTSLNQKSFRGTLIPIEASSAKLYRIDNPRDEFWNIDLRVGFESINYNCEFYLFDKSKLEIMNYVKKWDYIFAAGTFYSIKIPLETVVPKEFVYYICKWYDKELSLDWFAEHMNAKCGATYQFRTAVNPGTGIREVMMKYVCDLQFKPDPAQSVPAPEEAGDTAKHFTIMKSFLFHANVPNVFIFGRDRVKIVDKYVPTITEFIDGINKVTDRTSTATIEDTGKLFNADPVLEGFEIVDIKTADAETLKMFGTPEKIKLFDDILEPSDYNCGYWEYCNNTKNLGKFKIIFKSGNVEQTYKTDIYSNNMVYTIDNREELINNGSLKIYILVDRNYYREYYQKINGSDENIFESKSL